MGDRTVLLTGATGLLGTWLRRTAPDDVELVSLTHQVRLGGDREVVVDLRRRSDVVAAVADQRPALLLHAAYARDEASIVTATANVAHACARVGVAIVHVSSDAVFAGDGLPRPESASPDAAWDYGRWKAQAEEDVLRLLPTAAVVRLPLIVSIEPPDQMVTTILGGVSSGVRTVWYDDEVRQPALAADLAAGLWAIARLEGDRRAGLWHLPGPESLTRHQVAGRAAALLGLEADAIVGAPAPSPSDRPRHIHLSDDRAKADLSWAPSRVLLPGSGPDRA